MIVEETAISAHKNHIMLGYLSLTSVTARL
jgi:hypothetical protein